MADNTLQHSAIQEIERFLDGWTGSGQEVRARVRFFLDHLLAKDGVEIDFVARPKVSYSLRPRRSEQKAKGRSLFAMIDIIDDDPDNRWLSVCFYGDMISDPEERGEVIPGGLAGDDGYCFDMFDDDVALADYLVARLDEAEVAARG